jgi:hypothetical protein
MKLLSILLFAALSLTLISLNQVSAQDDMTITACQSRCGIRLESGQIVGNYQAIAACRDRCAREFWDKMDRQGQKRKSSLYDD